MNRSLRKISMVVGTLLLALTGVDLSAAPRHTGILGRTVLYSGPIFDGPPPLVVPAVVTTFPVATTFTVFSSQTHRVVARVSSDANGDFAIQLHPGRYLIVPASVPDSLTCSYATPPPFEVTVRAGQLTGAGFTYVGDCGGIGHEPLAE